MIEAGLLALLNANSTVSSLVGANIFPAILPDDVADPGTPTPTCCTYRMISAIDDSTNDGPLGMVKARIEYRTWATSYADAKTLAVAIRGVLNGYAGTLPDGTVVNNTWREGEMDGYDGHSRLYFVNAEYRILYTEPQGA